MPNHQDIDPMLTTGEVARLLNIHINTVRRWSNQGVLRTYRIGARGDRRFRREDITNFLDLDPMLTASEVARLLNVHINTVRRWSNQGVLGTYRIGARGDRRFHREDIINFLSYKKETGNLDTDTEIPSPLDESLGNGANLSLSVGHKDK
jgi:excisionase family DNA binding protein